MSRNRDFFWILICTSLLVFLGMTHRPLLKSSEGRVARVAQEMLEDGDWIVPHLNGNVRLEKPPFSSWLVALTARLTGASRVEPWHAYVPPGIAAVALVLLVFFWMSNANPAAPSCGISFAALSALILATAPGFLLQARSAEIDMLLALWVTLSIWGFWTFRAKDCAIALLLGYAGLGLAMLTKAHVGIVLSVPTLLIWHGIERQRMALSQSRAGSWRWHLVGCGLICAIVLPWAIPFLQRSGITWQDFNREGGSGRFSQETGHQENPFWYLYQLPGWFLPWTLLLPLALWQTWKLPADARSPLRRLCCCWLGWGVLLFSVLSSKQRHYAVPFFPPLAILIADAVERWAQHFEVDRRHFLHACLAIFSALLAAGSLILPLLAGRGASNPLPHENLTITWIMSALAAAAFLTSAWAHKRRESCLLSFWAGLLCLIVVFSETIEFRESQDSGLERFARSVRARVPANAPLYDYGVSFVHNVWRAQVLFYLQRKVDRSNLSISEVLQQGRQNAHVLATKNALKDVPVETYDVLLNEDTFLGHKSSVLLIRGR